MKQQSIKKPLINNPTNMKFTDYNKDSGKNNFANQYEKESIQLSALQSFLIGEASTFNNNSSIIESKYIKEFLETPINDKKENVLKKIITTAIYIAKSRGTLPVDLPDTPIEIASTVDEALTHLKVAYKSAIGELDIIDATDVLIDRLTIRTIAIADKIIEKGVPIAIDTFCFALSNVCPSVRFVIPIIKSFEKHITVATKTLVIHGIKRLAETAKSIVKKTISLFKTVTNKALITLKADI